MGISSNQIELLERILLNMRYNLNMTSKENSILVEQQVKKTTQEKLTSNIKLDKTISTFITRLSDEDLFKAANAWGWKNQVSQVYDKPTYDKLKKQSAASFLTKIRYPKFGPGNGIPANKRPPNITWGGVKDNQIIFTDFQKGIRQDKTKVVNPKLISKGIETTKQYREPEMDFSNYTNCLLTVMPNKYLNNNLISVDELLTYKNRVEYCKANHDLQKFRSNVFHSPKTDYHAWLSAISLVTGILGAIPTPLSPILLGVSLGCDLADATMYLSEGDSYSATIGFALAVIPGGELVKYVKGVSKVGKETVKQVIKKGASKIATQAEKEAAKELSEEILQESAEEIVKLTLKHAIFKFLKSLFLFKLQLLKNLVSWCLRTALKMGWSISKMTFKFAGIIFTFDMLYVAAYSDNKEFMTLREQSGFKELLDLLGKGSVELIKYIRETLYNWFTEKVEKGIDKGEEIDIFDFPNPDKETGAIDTSYAAQIVKKYETTIKKVEDTPKQTKDSIENVVNKKTEEEQKQILKKYEDMLNIQKKYEEIQKLQSTVTTQDTINK